MLQAHFTRPVWWICKRELVSTLVSTCFRNRCTEAPPNSVWPVQGIHMRGPCFQLVSRCFRHVCHARGPMFPPVSVPRGRAFRVDSTMNLRQQRGPRTFPKKSVKRGSVVTSTTATVVEVTRFLFFSQFVFGVCALGFPAGSLVPSCCRVFLRLLEKRRKRVLCSPTSLGTSRKRVRVQLLCPAWQEWTEGLVSGVFPRVSEGARHIEEAC